MFPFRTLSMILSALFLIFVSMLTQHLFDEGILSPKYDFLHCIVNIPEDAVRVDDPHEGEMTMMTAQTMAKYNATDEMNGRVNPALNLGSDSDEEAAANTPAPTTKTPDGKVKKRLVGEVISPPAVTSPRKQDMTQF